MCYNINKLTYLLTWKTRKLRVERVQSSQRKIPARNVWMPTY